MHHICNVWSHLKSHMHRRRVKYIKKNHMQNVLERVNATEQKRPTTLDKQSKKEKEGQ